MSIDLENSTCFDFIEVDYISIKQWLKTKRGSIIILDPNHHLSCYQRSTIKEYVADPTYRFKKCTQYMISTYTNNEEEEKKESTQQQVTEEKDDRIALKLPAGNTTWYVWADTAKEQCVDNKRARIFELIPTPTEGIVHWQRTISESIFKGSNAASGWHCGEGSNINIYTLIPLELENMMEILGEEEKAESVVLDLEEIEKTVPNLLVSRLNHFILTYDKSNNISLRTLHQQSIPSTKGLGVCLQSLCYSAIVGRKKRTLNSFVIYSSIQEAIEKITDNFSTSLGRNSHSLYVLVFIKNPREYVFNHSPLKSPHAYELCLLKTTLTTETNTQTLVLVHSCIINYTEDHMFCAQFDHVYFPTEGDRVYSSPSLMNLIRFVGLVLLQGAKDRLLLPYVMRKNAQHIRFDLTNQDENEGLIVDPVREDLPFFTNPKDYIDVIPYQKIDWIQEKWILDPEVNIRSCLQAIRYSSAERLSINDFIIYATEEEALRDNQFSRKDIFFTFLNSPPNHLLDESILKKQKIDDPDPIYLCCYRKPSREIGRFLYCTFILNLCIPEEREDISWNFSAQFDRFYFSKDEGMDAYTIYASGSLITLLQFLTYLVLVKINADVNAGADTV
jgi:hypothetical protein